MTTATTRTSEQEARRRSTVMWVVGLAFVGLVFDGYDLVVSNPASRVGPLDWRLLAGARYAGLR